MLDDGRLAEAGAPQSLLENPNGLFSGLWAQFEQSHDASLGSDPTVELDIVI